MIYTHIYFYINTFLAGMYFSEKNDDSFNDKIILLLIMLLFGTLLTLLEIAWYLFTSIIDYFQILFFLYYFFTSKFNNVSVSDLDDLNDIKDKPCPHAGVNGRIFKFRISLILKRNNYSKTKKHDIHSIK